MSHYFNFATSQIPLFFTIACLPSYLFSIVLSITMAGLLNFAPPQEHQAASEEQPQMEAPPDPIASQQGDVTLLECFSRAVTGHPQAELNGARSLLHNAKTPWHTTADMKVEMFESCGMCTLALAKRRFFLYFFSSPLLLLS